VSITQTVIENSSNCPPNMQTSFLCPAGTGDDDLVRSARARCFIGSFRPSRKWMLATWRAQLSQGIASTAFASTGPVRYLPAP
jgi:hypothetical protein